MIQIYHDQTNPILIAGDSIDWYRNGAIVGQANPDRPIGSRMGWRFGQFGLIQRPTLLNLHLGIL